MDNNPFRLNSGAVLQLLGPLFPFTFNFKTDPDEKAAIESAWNSFDSFAKQLLQTVRCDTDLAALDLQLWKKIAELTEEFLGLHDISVETLTESHFDPRVATLYQIASHISVCLFSPHLLWIFEAKQRKAELIAAARTRSAKKKSLASTSEQVEAFWQNYEELRKRFVGSINNLIDECKKKQNSFPAPSTFHRQKRRGVIPPPTTVKIFVAVFQEQSGIKLTAADLLVRLNIDQMLAKTRAASSG